MTNRLTATQAHESATNARIERAQRETRLAEELLNVVLENIKTAAAEGRYEMPIDEAYPSYKHLKVCIQYHVEVELHKLGFKMTYAGVIRW